MAEGSSVNPDDVVCRFFLTSSCRDGDRCLFSHDSARRIPDNVCRYYLQNRCQFGPRCRYDHVRIKRNSNSKVCCQNDRHLAGPSRQHADNATDVSNVVKQDVNRKDTYLPRYSFLHRNSFKNDSSLLDQCTSSTHDWCAASEVLVDEEIGTGLMTTSGAEPKSDTSSRNKFKNEISCRDEFKSAVSNGDEFSPHPTNWHLCLNAPEFVPKTVKSYADTLKSDTVLMHPEPEKLSFVELCEYYIHGECPFEDQCPYIHGNMCELCRKNCLHPFDEKQQKDHTELCEKELEQDMELSFAVQRSHDKTCGICMDVILEKDPVSERRFGILEKCNHVFCLSCIRKWRRSKQYESNPHIDSVLDPVVTRACPECRVSSDFITPSLYWVDTEEEKKKLITEYKVALSKKPCKYFKQGKGTCPFGGACFYLHAKPDGTKVELPPPTRRRRQNQDGELDYMGRIFLWDYLEFREENILMQLDLEEFMYTLSDTEDDLSDVSDNFFLTESF